MYETIYGITEVAKILGVSERKACELIKREDFPVPVMEHPLGTDGKGGRISWWFVSDIEKFKKVFADEARKKEGKRGRPLKNKAKEEKPAET